MKKHLSFLFFFVALLFSFAVQAQQSLPYTENFNSYTDGTGKKISTNNVAPSNYTLSTNTMPTGWVVTGLNRSGGTSTPQAFLTSSTDYASSGNCLFVKTSSTKKVYFALPIMAQAIDSLKISFKAKNRSGYAATVSVGWGMYDNGVSVDIKSTFTPTPTYATYTHDFTQNGPVGNYRYIYIVVGSCLNGYVSIDDVEVSVVGSQPQDTSTTTTGNSIGNGTVDNSTISPLKSSNGTYGSMVWNMYSASELGYSTAKTITKIGYYYAGCSNTSCSDVSTVPIKIYMATTAKSSFAQTSDTISRANMTLVYSGKPHFAYDRWSDITLTTPFNYNPASGNLVVLVVRTQNMPDFSRSYYFRSSKVVGATVYQYRTTGNYMGGTSQDRANIRLTTLNNSQPTTQYVITALAADASMGSVAGGGAYAVNAVATLNAIPNSGYAFKQWSDGNTSNPRQVTVTGNATYTAIFQAATMYSLTVTSANSTMGSVSGTGSYASGTSVTMTASPYTHYHFVRWNDGSTTNPRSIIITSDTSFSATFAPDQYNLSVVANDASYGVVTGSGTYDYNEQATLTATANTGYHFVSWSDGSTENPHTIVVTRNNTITANFAPDGSAPTTNFALTLSVNNSTMGSVWGGGSYANGASVTAIAIANEGYRFVSWSNGSTVNPYTFILSSDTTLVANFEVSTSNTYAIIGKPNNDNYGTVEGSGSYQYGESVTLTAVAAPGYRFVNWNDGNTDIDRTIIVASSAVFIANFAPDGFMMTYTITGYSNDYNMGTVQGGGSFAENTCATLVAVPIAGFRFIRWSNGSNTNPLFINVTEDASYTAIFAVENPNTPYFDVTVISNNTALGTVSGGGSYQYGDSVTLVATPKQNAQFVMWSDGDTNSTRVVVATAAYTYVANFASTITPVTYYFASIYSNDETMGNVSGTGRYPEGSVVVAMATANSGHAFIGWSNNSTANPLLMTITSDTTIVASFEANAPIVTPTDSAFITLLVNDVTMGEVVGSGMYAKGSNVQIIASAKRGYSFVRWNDGNLDAIRTIHVTGDATYIATFEKNQGIDAIQYTTYTCSTMGRSVFVKSDIATTVRIYSTNGYLVGTSYGIDHTLSVNATGIYYLVVGSAPAKRLVIMR